MDIHEEHPLSSTCHNWPLPTSKVVSTPRLDMTSVSETGFSITSGVP